MKEHPRSTSLLTTACSALWSITVDTPRLHIVCRSNAVECVLSVMAAHPRDGFLQRNVCGALCNLLADPALCGGVKWDKVSTLSLAAVSHHPTDERIAEYVGYILHPATRPRPS